MVRSSLSDAIGAISSWVDATPTTEDETGSLGLPPLSAHIVIDGASVAWAHGEGKRFSVAGLRAAVDYFTKRGWLPHALLNPKPEPRNKP